MSQEIKIESLSDFKRQLPIALAAAGRIADREKELEVALNQVRMNFPDLDSEKAVYAERMAAIEAFALKNRKEVFGDAGGGTFETRTAVVTMGKSPPAVSVPKSKKIPELIAELQADGTLKEFVKTSPSLDKNAIKQALKEAGTIASEKLKACGVKLSQGWKFSLKSK
jgi:phage host-nuclease inhibitor protein Gam